ncbi:hypothetical protein DICA3_C17656 [Diutina catenulata]
MLIRSSPRPNETAAVSSCVRVEQGSYTSSLDCTSRSLAPRCILCKPAASSTHCVSFTSTRGGWRKCDLTIVVNLVIHYYSNTS